MAKCNFFSVIPWKDIIKYLHVYFNVSCSYILWRYTLILISCRILICHQEARNMSRQISMLKIPSRELNGHFHVRVRVLPPKWDHSHWSNWSPVTSWVVRNKEDLPQETGDDTFHFQVVWATKQKTAHRLFDISFNMIAVLILRRENIDCIFNVLYTV